MCNGCETETEKRKAIVEDLKIWGQDSILTESAGVLHKLSLTIGGVCDLKLARKATEEYEDLTYVIHDFGQKVVETFEDNIDLIVEDRVEELRKKLSVSYRKLVRKTALIERERDRLKRQNLVLLRKLECMKEEEED